MGLFSVFQRSAKAESESADDLQRQRTRARRRLIGAVVLVGLGIVGFPLIFETHPRPIPIDTPIEIANKDKVPPLAMPPAKGGSSTAARGDAMVTESPSDAGREVPPPAGSASSDGAATKPSGGDKPVEPSAGRPADKAHDKPAEKLAEKQAEKQAERPTEKPAAKADKPAERPAERPADKPAAKPAGDADAARARALLEGKPAPATVAAADARYIVQVGAYADSDAARDVRQKVEKLGLKTYTQVVDTSAGSRIRVRIGPFASRDEADKAVGRLKSAGLPSAVLTL